MYMMYMYIEIPAVFFDGAVTVLKSTIIYWNKALARMTGVQYNHGSLLLPET